MPGIRTRWRAVRRLGTCILVLVFTLFALLFWYDTRESERSAFFSQQLSRAGDVHVVVQNRSFVVRNGVVFDANSNPIAGDGEVLALAYEKLAAERSPFFALPGIDLGNFNAAVDKLVATSQALSRVQKDSAAAWDVAHDLYPIDLLRSLSTLEAARRQFIASGTDTDAREYDMLLDATANEYQNSNRRFSSSFERNVPSNSPEYATELNVISRSGSISAIKTLADGARTISAEISRRDECIHWDTTRCDPTAIELPTMAIASSSASLSIIPETTRSLLSLYEQEGLAFDRGAPLFALTASRCTKPRDGTAPLYTFYTPPDGVEGVPFYIGDARFLSTERFASLPFFDYFAKNDIPYVVSVPLSYYSCTEDDADEGTISALRDITHFARSEHLSSVAHGATGTSLAHDEVALSNAVVSELDIRTYLRDALPLIGTGELTQAQERSLVALALELNDRSYGLYDTILNVISMEGGNLKLKDSGVSIDAGAPYLFFVRSAFAQLFLEANPSAVGPHGALFPPNGLSEAELPFVFYSQASSTTARRALDTSMRFYTALHYGM